MAYIGQNLDRFSNVEKLDAITPATSTGAGPYNLLKGGVAFTPSSADTMVVSIDGVIQYGNFSVSGSTITFNAALADANTCDFIYHMGTGLLSTPVDNSVSTAKIVDSNVTTAKIANSAVTDAKIAATISNSKLTGSGAITINGSAVALGGSVTVGETKPTISSISPAVITNAQTAITITGQNFISVPQVEAINSTGAITSADSVSFTSATTIVATFTLPVDGTYFIRIENNDGNAVRSSSALLNVSDVPAWVTGAGSLGSFSGGDSIGTITLTATNSVSMAKTSGTLPGGITLNSGSGSSTLTGTESGATADTTYTFTITATDAEGQTAAREFTLTFNFGANNSGQFN
tara:strand:+ start:74 stop:1120 length:1047 start_codon:yes stop_codon:yes gene_type:complete